MNIVTGYAAKFYLYFNIRWLLSVFHLKNIYINISLEIIITSMYGRLLVFSFTIRNIK